MGLLRHDARYPSLLDLDAQAGQAPARSRRDDHQAGLRPDGLRIAADLDHGGGADAQGRHEAGDDEEDDEEQEGGLQDRSHSGLRSAVRAGAHREHDTTPASEIVPIGISRGWSAALAAAHPRPYTWPALTCTGSMRYG